MTLFSLFSLVPLMLGLAGAHGAGAPPEVRRLVVDEQLILRVPVRPRLVPPRFEWEERKGPKCLPTRAIVGASLAGPREVDFILSSRTRLRAELDDDCPALDFYDGLYLKPEDAELCAKRDLIHSRVGGSCRIDRFRHLVPRFDR